MSMGAEGHLCRLVYRSRSLLTGSDLRVEEAFVEIVARSQANNARCGVTGALVAVGDAFVQVLEGPRGAVEEVFERICRDRRHTDLQVVDVGEAPARAFGEWAMKRISTSTGAEALFARFGESASHLGQAPAAAEEAVSLMATLVRLELAAQAAATPRALTNTA